MSPWPFTGSIITLIILTHGSSVRQELKPSLLCKEREVCAVEGSSVTISCEYTATVGELSHERHWFNDNKRTTWTDRTVPQNINDDPDYVGRIVFKASCALGNPYTESAASALQRCEVHLKILDLRTSDTSLYRYWMSTQNHGFIPSNSGTTLSVTGLQVSPREIDGGQWNFTCVTTCTLQKDPAYVWFRNGRRLQGPNSNSDHLTLPVGESSGSFSCAVEGLADLRSPAVCVLDPGECWDISHARKSICTVTGFMVDIPCSFTLPPGQKITAVSWTTESSPHDVRRLPQYAGRVEYRGDGKGDCSLRITQLRKSDSARYKFLVHTREKIFNDPTGVALDVKDLEVSIHPSTVDEGQSAWIGCTENCVNLRGRLALYKDRQMLNFSFSSHLHLPSVRIQDAGNYYCALIGQDVLSLSNYLTVRYAPRSTKVTAAGVTKGGQVTGLSRLSCSSDANPAVQTYTWFSRNSHNVTVVQRGTKSSYVVQRGSAHQYFCEATNVLGSHNSTTTNDKHNTKMVVSIVAAVMVVVVLAAGALLVFLCCTLKRRNNAGKDVTTDEERIYSVVYRTSGTNVCEDSEIYDDVQQSDTYAGLQRETCSSDYETIQSLTH